MSDASDEFEFGLTLFVPNYDSQRSEESSRLVLEGFTSVIPGWIALSTQKEKFLFPSSPTLDSHLPDLG